VWWNGLSEGERVHWLARVPSASVAETWRAFKSQLPIGDPVYRLRDVQHIGAFVEPSAALRRAEHPELLRRALARTVSVAISRRTASTIT